MIYLPDDYEIDSSLRPKVEFYLADVSWKNISKSTKLSFLVIVEQAFKAKAQGIEFSINPDGKAYVAVLIENKSIPIVFISPGIFDRYWQFLTLALKSPGGLQVKKENEIFRINGEIQELLGGRKIILKFSNPVKLEKKKNDDDS